MVRLELPLNWSLDGLWLLVQASIQISFIVIFVFAVILFLYAFYVHGIGSLNEYYEIKAAEEKRQLELEDRQWKIKLLAAIEGLPSAIEFKSRQTPR